MLSWLSLPVSLQETVTVTLLLVCVGSVCGEEADRETETESEHSPVKMFKYLEWLFLQNKSQGLCGLHHRDSCLPGLLRLILPNLMYMALFAAVAMCFFLSPSDVCGAFTLTGTTTPCSLNDRVLHPLCFLLLFFFSP